MTGKEKREKDDGGAQVQPSYYFEGYYDSVSSVAPDTHKRALARGEEASGHDENNPTDAEQTIARGILRTILIAAALLAALVCLVFIVQFAMSYELAVTNDDGKVSFVFSKKDPAQTQEELSILPLEGVLPQFQPDGTGGQSAAGVRHTEASLLISPYRAGQTQLTFRQIYEHCAGSIVIVTSTKEDETLSASGIIMTEDGYIITSSGIAAHGARTIVSVPADKTRYEAEIVGRDDATRLAVLKISASGLTPAVFGDSDSLSEGDIAAAIGNTANGTVAISNGIISAMDENASYNGFAISLILTSAAMNEGTSGGALVNGLGQIVGIAEFEIGRDMGYPQGINCAIPTTEAKKVVDELIRYGYVHGRPALGISMANVPAAASVYYGFPVGVYVGDVAPGSSAYEQGIRRGDIIVSFNGRPVKNTEEFGEYKNSCAVGDTVTLVVYRQREFYSVDVVLMDSSEIG